MPDKAAAGGAAEKRPDKPTREAPKFERLEAQGKAFASFDDGAAWIWLCPGCHCWRGVSERRCRSCRTDRPAMPNDNVPQPPRNREAGIAYVVAVSGANTARKSDTEARKGSGDKSPDQK